MALIIKFTKFITIILLVTACASYEQFQQMTEEMEIPTKVYKADYNQAWQAVIQFMKKYDLALQNQEAGVIKTRWIDNTLEMNFADSFGGADSVKAAKFKLIINVIKGYRGNREVSKISIFKRQMVEQDMLQGWKVLPSDGIMEKTILYRLDRILMIDNQLKEIEEKRSKEAEKNF